MSRLVFGGPIPEGVCPWPEDVRRADQAKIDQLKVRRDRLEERWANAHELIDRLGQEIDDIEAQIAELEGEES